MTESITEDQLRKFLSDWYDKLDKHALWRTADSSEQLKTLIQMLELVWKRRKFKRS